MSPFPCSPSSCHGCSDACEPGSSATGMAAPMSEQRISDLFGACGTRPASHAFTAATCHQLAFSQTSRAAAEASAALPGVNLHHTQQRQRLAKLLVSQRKRLQPLLPTYSQGRRPSGVAIPVPPCIQSRSDHAQHCHRAALNCSGLIPGNCPGHRVVVSPLSDSNRPTSVCTATQSASEHGGRTPRHRGGKLDACAHSKLQLAFAFGAAAGADAL